MKSLTQIIQHTYEQKSVRNWSTLYWAIDLHDTVIQGKYNRFNEGAEIFPHAKEVLDYLYNSKTHKTILWTSSWTDAVDDILKRYDLKFDYFNENPECPSTELCNFNDKFYFNILLDDKSGFAGKIDWTEIKEALEKYDPEYPVKPITSDDDPYFRKIRNESSDTYYDGTPKPWTCPIFK